MTEQEVQFQLQEQLEKRYSEYTSIERDGIEFRVKVLDSDAPRISYFKYNREADELKILFGVTKEENFEKDELNESLCFLIKENQLKGLIFRNFSLSLAQGFVKAMESLTERFKNFHFDSLKNELIEERKVSFLQSDFIHNQNLKSLVGV